jgi:hypothetical protein
MQAAHLRAPFAHIPANLYDGLNISCIAWVGLLAVSSDYYVQQEVQGWEWGVQIFGTLAFASLKECM